MGSVPNVSAVEVLSQHNRMQLNVDKYKEMVIEFKNSHNYSCAVVSGNELPVCSSIELITVFGAILRGRKSGQKLQGLYGNPMANNFFRN